jgi:hypothetical protein
MCFILIAIANMIQHFLLLLIIIIIIIIVMVLNSALLLLMPMILGFLLGTSQTFLYSMSVLVKVLSARCASASNIVYLDFTFVGVYGFIFVLWILITLTLAFRMPKS